MIVHCWAVAVLLAPGGDRAPIPPGANEFPVFAGKSVCLECHSDQQTGGMCTYEPCPKHDDSYKALKTPKAKDIATLSGISGRPSQSRICLYCHATAGEEGPRWTAETFRIDDGVQCERCHDAGSFHVDAYRLGNGQSLPPGERLIRRGNREDCAACHIARESHRQVLELGFTLEDSDELYKTPVTLTTSPDGKRLYVVCEHSNSVVVVDTATRRVIREITVGRRPHDIAVSPDGAMLYVTNRMGDNVSVIDTASGEVAGEIGVGAEPHGVILDQTGRRLFVLNTGENTISVIDAHGLTEIKRIVAGAGPWSVALRPDRRTCYVSNVRPSEVRFRDPPQSEVTVVDVERGIVTGRLTAPETNMMQGIAALNTDIALFTMMRTKNLIPITRLAQGWTITNGLGIIWPDGRIDQVLLDEPANYFPDPMDVAASPDGLTALVVSGGSDQVAVVDIPKLVATVTGMSDRERDEVLPNHLGMSTRFIVKRLHVGANPRAVVYSPDGRFAYVATSLDDSVAVIDTSRYAVIDEIKLGGPDEVTQIRRGERAFHSADITFGRQFSCASCHPDGHVNALSFDIQADGIGMKHVDNRTLRGIIDTFPFKWEGTNPSLHRQCGPRLAVFFTRVAPFAPDELDALVRYMCTIERPPNRHREPEGLTLSQRRGKAIFERTVDNDGTPLTPQQRCVSCHGSAYQTSRKQVPILTTMWFDEPIELESFDLYDAEEFGRLGSYYYVETRGVTPSLVFDVPHLTNIYNSAPYMHNGAANSLEEMWTRLDVVGHHGKTIDLTRRQFNDLIAYLKSL